MSLTSTPARLPTTHTPPLLCTPPPPFTPGPACRQTHNHVHAGISQYHHEPGSLISPLPMPPRETPQAPGRLACGDVGTVVPCLEYRVASVPRLQPSIHLHVFFFLYRPDPGLRCPGFLWSSSLSTLPFQTSLSTVEGGTLSTLSQKASRLLVLKCLFVSCSFQTSPVPKITLRDGIHRLRLCLCHFVLETNYLESDLERWMFLPFPNSLLLPLWVYHPCVNRLIHHQ